MGGDHPHGIVPLHVHGHDNGTDHEHEYEYEYAHEHEHEHAYDGLKRCGALPEGPSHRLAPLSRPGVGLRAQGRWGGPEAREALTVETGV